MHKDVSDNTLYNRWHHERMDEDDLNNQWYDIVKENLNYERDLTDKEVLEIGCGRGSFSIWLSQTAKMKKLYACDFSTEALNIGRKKAEQLDVNSISWEKEDLLNLSYPDNMFDTIISCETIEHIPSPKKGVAELLRVLKPNGTLFLTFPNHFNLFGVWRVYREIIGKPYTEGGQPITKYIHLPRVRRWLGKNKTQIIAPSIMIPGRIPKHIDLPHPKALFRWFTTKAILIITKRELD